MSSQGNVVTSRQSLKLDLPPSCIEFCPAHPRYFIVGTYNLQRDEPQANTNSDSSDDQSLSDETSQRNQKQTRSGTLVIFEVDSEGTISEKQVASQPSAVLDLHFCPLPGWQDILAVVSSTGTLAIFRLDPETNASSPLQHLATSTISDVPEGVLFLSCAWHPGQPNIIAITTSTGEVRLVLLDDARKIADGGHGALITHTLEAWTVAFAPLSMDLPSAGDVHSAVTVFSGGDDSALRYTSLGSADVEPDRPVFQALHPPIKMGGHEAGVTAILPTSCQLKDGAHVVITGSYDDYIRVSAIQPLNSVLGTRRPRCLAELYLGGGVWRLKLIMTETEQDIWKATILASCMHAGARIAKVVGSLDGENWTATVLSRFEEHQSMNYGSDFLPGTGNDILVCVSTSFYDRLLCLWESTLD
ncbi:hypothetical protein SODALDRAFT_326875 [Sodiomyces alkalinus F11]|uniref:WD40 repeat-like protein n=1 Tax=Sodiomyces alkalinus (strain CBS 110278 / VKM F-3762 / F11) TaxID=1314773 RepID=A0A3N2Q7G3_SODAK|nr:hypothetical protein SODALDRAFT_326875 [Sodiomyces alkalinus F11]ROT42721.1 hypothetical protein SODALDRAFT_326875 [Sodiomyces alkalinus F11]